MIRPPLVSIFERFVKSSSSRQDEPCARVMQPRLPLPVWRVRTFHLRFIHQFAVNSAGVWRRRDGGAGAACRRASMRVTPQRGARGRCRRYAFVVALALGSAFGIRSAGAAETLTVVLDQAQIMPLPDRVGTIIIGNPLIADV